MESYNSLGISFVREKLMRLREQLEDLKISDTYIAQKNIVNRYIDHQLMTLDALFKADLNPKDLVNKLFSVKNIIPAIEENVISLKLINSYEKDSIRLIKAIANLNADSAHLFKHHCLFSSQSGFGILQTPRLKKYAIESGVVGLPFLFYVPMSEEVNILSAPPIAHEIGHIYTQYYEDELSKDYDNRYGIIDFLRKAQSRIIRISNKQKQKKKIDNYHNIIKNWFLWRFEIASDIFAVYLMGPAFALYMLIFLIGSDPFKKTGNEYSHPSPNLRFQLIFNLLERNLGENEIIAFMKKQWAKYIEISEGDDENTIDTHEWSQEFIDIYLSNICAVFNDLNLSSLSLPDFFHKMGIERIKDYYPESLVEAINLMWIKRILSQEVKEKYLSKEFFKKFIQDSD